MKNRFSILCLLLSYATFCQSKVDQSKSELKSGSSSSNSSSSSNNHSNSNSCSNKNDDDSDDCIWLDITIGFFKYGLIGDYNNEDHLYNNLTDYPYYNKESGNYENYKSIDADTLKKDFRFDLENNLLYSSNRLYGNHLKVKIRPFHYFYVQTDFHQLYEKNDLSNTTDRLSLFHFNLGYDRVRFENVNLGWTIGASYVGNDVKKAGLSFGINTEMFFSHNISLAAAAKWSAINGKPVNVYDIQARYHTNRYFVSLGFEHLRIASPNYNFISLGGGIYLN